MTEAIARSSTPQDGERPLFSIVSAVYNVSRYLGEYIESLEAQTFGLGRVQVILVDDGSTDDSRTVLEEWAASSRGEVVVLHQENAGQAAARNRGLERATGEWVTFIDPDDTINPEFFESMAAFAAAHPDVQFLSANVVLRNESTGALAKHPRWKMYEADRLIDLDVATSFIPGSSTTSLMRRDAIAGLRFNPELRPNFEDGDFAVRFLLGAPNRTTGFIGSARYFYRKRSDQSSTLQTGISATGRYSVVPREGYLALMREARSRNGSVPIWVQHIILYELSWYFSSEDAMGNSASAISGELGESFRSTLGEICDLLDPDVVDAFSIRKLLPHWRDILLYGLRGRQWHTPYVITDRYDRTKGMVRVLYRYIGDPPEEVVLARGRERAPQYAKTRAISFFGDVVMWERILWVDSRTSLEVRLDGSRMEITGGWRGPRIRVLGARAIANRFRRPGRRRREALGRLKVDPIRVLAAQAQVRKRFAGAWVLMDRIHDANDSGEILFRWLRTNRPDVNAWFVLEKDTPDWHRLKVDGYGPRLIAHGTLRWKLLMINAAHLVSSHIDVPVERPPAILKLIQPRWKFTFLQHGVIKDDLSRWLNPKRVDLFVTSTSAEYESIAGDGSPYVFSAKEVALTGLPRFDRLHAKAQQITAEERNLILVAPTWRNWLVPPLKPGTQRRVLDESFFDTDYAVQWTSFLSDGSLAALAERTGKTIAFLPHPNIQPFLERMELPPAVAPLSFDGADVQDYFARAAVLVTDYSSMAFNTAYMDRPVVYFQFDAARVMAGGHVGRAGYFEYDRDGFGPVVDTVRDAVAAVVAIAEDGYALDRDFQTRVDDAFPERDGQCCARVTAAIERLDSPNLPQVVDESADDDLAGEDAVSKGPSATERPSAGGRNGMSSAPRPDFEIAATEWSRGARGAN